MPSSPCSTCGALLFAGTCLKCDARPPTAGGPPRPPSAPRAWALSRRCRYRRWQKGQLPTW